MPDLSIIIPVYCSEDSLDELYRRLVATLDNEAKKFEIVFVEDCGDDNSWDIIKQLVANDPRVRGLHMSRNYGQHNALLCGIRAATGEVIVTLDDDLQNPPEEIPKLLARLDQGYDLVYGTAERRRHGLLRDLASHLIKFALRGVMDAETTRTVSAFRAFRTELRQAFVDYRSPSVNLDVLFAWGTTRFSSVRVRHEVRQAGTSGYTLRKLFSHAVNMTTGFSTLPLQFASIAGFVFALFGIAILGYVVFNYFLYDDNVPGFAFLASIIAIFSGVQLFALGIIGEYLARMHFRAMDRPPYLVREQVGQSEDLLSTAKSRN